MHDTLDAVRGRRALLKNGLALGGILALAGPATAVNRITSRALKPVTPPLPVAAENLSPHVASQAARPITSPRVVRPDLMRRALAALDQHGGTVARDRIAIADFAASSSQPRFHFVDLVSGRSTSFLVAHGSGSDPAHSGYLKRFSNEFGSNATSEGAFLTDNYYVGKHGRSQRLIGLDATNNNALGRAIVVHAAWYANADMIRTRGMLGRSQGCFAVGERDLDRVFAQLGQGRMIYATKV